MKKCIFLLMFFLYTCITYSQSLSVFDIDTTNFPIMKAKFFALDKDGKQIRPNASDFSITENGQPRTVLNVTCPSPKPQVPLSSVLVFDVSGSMSGSPLDMEKDVANSWINMLPLGNSDCAITSFSDNNYINQDFTTNKNKLVNAINGLTIISGTDYNAAMIDPAAGGILMAKTGKHKRIIIFLTDGQPNFEPRTQEIIDEAINNGITIYCLSINMPAHHTMIDFSNQTGGLYFENIKSKEEAEDALRKVYTFSQNSDKCEIEWKSELSCELTINKVEFNIIPQNLIANLSYQLPISSLAYLEFSPLSIFLKNVNPGNKKDTSITVTARKAAFNITNIKSSNSAFTINKTNFILLKDQSIDLIVSFVPIDSGYSFTNLTFESNTCNTNFFVSGGFAGKKPKLKTLKLTKPNGSEEFVIGSDTLIKWEGIPETDNVKLEYSIDNGITWKLITNNATGLKYIWKNIPKPESKQCLVKVSQNINKNIVDSLPQIEWQKVLGGSLFDQASSIQQTFDGGYIVSGYSQSDDGDVSINKGSGDFWIIKLNHEGLIEWQKVLGGSSGENACAIQQTMEGDYIVAGYTYSNDGDVSGNQGFGDWWIVKLDNMGNIKWQKTLGGSNDDQLYAIRQTSDSGYICVGSTGSNDGDVSNNHGKADYWVVKLNSSGSIEWQKTYGGSSIDIATSIQQTFEGGYIVSGYSDSNDGDISGNHGLSDYWIIKLGNKGSIEWQKAFGGTSGDFAFSILQTMDGGYIVFGTTDSNDNDVIGNHGESDCWIVKLSNTGILEWQKTLGGSEPDWAGYSNSNLQQTIDGGYILTASINSNDGDISGKIGNSDWDGWIIKLSSLGSIEWQKVIGGFTNDYLCCIQQTLDNGFIIAGYIEPNDNYYGSCHGLKDYWIVKLSPDGRHTLQEDISDSVFSIVAPQASANNIDMKECLLGMVKDSVITDIIENIGTYPVRIDSIYFTGDSSNFRLLSHILPISIKPKGKISLEFGFGPARVGLHSADMIILAQSDTLFKKIIGTGYQPQLVVSAKIIDFGQIEIGNERTFTDTALVKNISISPITINKVTQMGPDKKQFEILSSLSSFTLQPNEEKKLTLKFKPVFGGRTTGQIAFEYNGVGSPVIVGLFGTGIGGNLRISNDSAYPGESRNLKLIMEKVKPEGISAIAPNFEAIIRFQNTIIAPVNNSNWTITNDSTYLTIKGKFGTSNEIAQIPVVAGLGSVEETAIDIVNFVLKDDAGNIVDYDFESESGAFKLLGICPEGGNRLINPDGEEVVLKIAPNPSDGKLSVEINLIEKGSTSLTIYDNIGNIVFEKNFESFRGKLELNIETSKFATGLYFVSLKTPTIRKMEELIVLK